MKLTNRQEQMVHAFLRESGRAVQQLSPAAQAQTLSQVRRRLRDELRQLPHESLKDEDLSDLLNRLRVAPTASRTPGNGESAPAFQLHPESSRSAPAGNRPRAEAPPQKKAPEARHARRRSRHPLASSQREWLGVCLGLAEQWGISPIAVRTAFVIGGLFTGPLAVLLYLGMYAAQYRAAGADVPRVNRARVWRMGGGVAAALAALFAATAGALWAVDFVYARVFGQPLEPGVWGNFRENLPIVLAGGFLVFVPFAVLASLPLANDWAMTLTKVIKAALALFALLLCLGFASYLAGALIAAAQAWAG